MLRVCETNQLDRKTFGHCRAGTVCTYSLLRKNLPSQLERSPLRKYSGAIVCLLLCGRSSNLFNHISPEKRILRQICRLAACRTQDDSAATAEEQASGAADKSRSNFVSKLASRQIRHSVFRSSVFVKDCVAIETKPRQTAFSWGSDLFALP
jgi:hypothetical protein